MDVLKPELYIVEKGKRTGKFKGKEEYGNMSLEQLWKKIQSLVFGGFYLEGISCSHAIREKSEKAKNLSLYRRSLLILSRLYAIAGDNDSSHAFYKKMIASCFSEQFVYVNRYSFSVDLFVSAKDIGAEHSFVFEELLLNSRHKKTKEEVLFYLLITCHLNKQSPWESQDPRVNLSLLPAHIRVGYLELTSDYHMEEYKKIPGIFDKNPINYQHSKYFKNIHCIFFN
ncbi:hypothetical protein NEFER03_0910 [Nematocida sp. LUAm3]|nr:hypothetical protein NEFER03_0910 [Nematocida sp. LUAm3]KAI5174928.1 hypothetical protein NEFER02_1028 [Nematocida sp. LUAm2]KAI5177473.1 hypothetical protein NEFER01_0723 [Nematocida sp. LUAm1]